MPELSAHQVRYLTEYKHRLQEKNIIWDLLGTVIDRTVVKLSKPEFASLKKGSVEPEQGLSILPGDLVLVTDGSAHCWAYGTENELRYLNSCSSKNPERSIPVMWTDTFTLKKGMIENYNGDPVKTTAGLFLLNYVLLVVPFKDVVPYINEKWKPGTVEDAAADALMTDKVTVQQVKKFVNNAFFIGSLSMLCVPTATAKSFVTDSLCTKRKKELLEKYEGRLNDPVIAHKIDEELIALDKEFVKGDPAARFYDAIGKNAYELHRASMLLTQGGVESFSDGTQDFNFIENALADGWDPKDFAHIANETRKGSYMRGNATQLGGALSKFIMRVFQNIEIIEKDCGTRKTLPIKITKHNSKRYTARRILDNNKWVDLTSANIAQYVGKTVQMRSAQTCQTKKGLCYTCAGDVYSQLDLKALAMVATQITSAMMMKAMKAMHGSTIETDNIDLEEDLVVV